MKTRAFFIEGCLLSHDRSCITQSYPDMSNNRLKDIHQACILCNQQPPPPRTNAMIFSDRVILECSTEYSVHSSTIRIFTSVQISLADAEHVPSLSPARIRTASLSSSNYHYSSNATRLLFPSYQFPLPSRYSLMVLSFGGTNRDFFGTRCSRRVLPQR